MATRPNWPQLAQGQNSKNVKALQHLLVYRGYSISTDGIFGSGTRTAVVNFQTSRGLSADGVAGANTLSALITNVSNGSNGQAAYAAQTLLSKFETLDVDGMFYGGSASAARTFQQKMGVSVDGIVGPTTWQYLFGYNTYPAGTGGGGSGEEPGDDSAIQGNKDYRGQNILTDSQLALLNGNKRFYQNAAAIYGIPWQMIAAIHYREYGLRKAGPSNGHGPYQMWGDSFPVGNYSDAQFQDATNKAAAFIKEKLGGRSCSSTDNVKYGFFAYNGIASAYKTQALNLGFSNSQANNGEGSPYVMNRYDQMRDPTVEPTKSNNTWGQIKTDGGPITYPANSDYGAYVVYCSLL